MYQCYVLAMNTGQSPHRWKTGGNGNIVLQKNAENRMGGARKHQRNFKDKENKITHSQNHKQTTEIT